MKKKTKHQDPEPETRPAGETAPETGDPAEEPVSEFPAHDQEMVRLRRENEQLEGKLQRAMADLQNFRKRQSREMQDMRTRTLEGLAAELLPVLDNFALAFDAHRQQSEIGQSDPNQALVEGLRMVQSLLSGALERHGVTEIPAQDCAFDPNRHEAVGVEPRQDVDPGVVVRVLQPGYALGERVIRPSRVMVSGPATDDGSANPDGAPEDA